MFREWPGLLASSNESMSGPSQKEGIIEFEEKIFLNRFVQSLRSKNEVYCEKGRFQNKFRFWAWAINRF
jgi:hypothetical protein